MTQVTLQLGNVVFQDFEVPEKIKMGGQQMLITHKFPGGTRVIDAMGPDDAEIVWSGRFRGAYAEARMRQLDLMRQQGLPLTLTWGTLIYVVLIASFEAEYQQPWEIPYTITCTVLTDPTLQNVSPLPTAADAVTSDLNSSMVLGTTINQSPITSALATLQTAVGQAGILAAAQAPQVAAIRGALSAAQVANSAAMVVASGNISVSGVGGVVAGGVPAAMALGLVKTANNLAVANNVLNLGNLLGRMSDNLSNIGN